MTSTIGLIEADLGVKPLIRRRRGPRRTRGTASDEREAADRQADGPQDIESQPRRAGSSESGGGGKSTKSPPASTTGAKRRTGRRGGQRRGRAAQGEREARPSGGEPDVANAVRPVSKAKSAKAARRRIAEKEPSKAEGEKQAKPRAGRSSGRRGGAKKKVAAEETQAPPKAEVERKPADKPKRRRTTKRTKKAEAPPEEAATSRTAKATKTSSPMTVPRARIPVVGAPTEEVPAPFAHPAEYEFARILDFYGIEWRYEPRSFPLRWERGHVAEAFTPDFYLPDLNLYVEVTTLKTGLTSEKNRKMRHIKELYPEVNIMMLKKRDYLRLLAKYGYGPLSPDQVPDVGRVLLTASRVQRRVGELGAQISRDYTDREPVLIGILRGVMCFMADLMRHISVPTTVDFMAISAYESNGGAAVRILKDLDENVKGRDILLVEDIVDTGMTLNHILDYLGTKRPASIKVCTLLDKRARRIVSVPIDYVGFEIPDEFVVGYGLDFQQRFRNLPFIGILKHELLP